MEVAELRQILARVQLVDVRETDEWEVGHVEGATHVPLARIAEGGVDLNAAQPVVAVCRTGGRSERAAALLGEAGFDAYSLEGGLKAWVEAGNPLIGSDGEPGRVLDAFDPDNYAQPEFAALEGNLIEVAFGLQERFGNREPTDEEAREFMREWLQGKGHSEAEIQQIIGED